MGGGNKNPINLFSHGFKSPGNFTSLVIIVHYQKNSRHLRHPCLLDTFSSNQIAACFAQVFIFKPLLFTLQEVIFTLYWPFKVKIYKATPNFPSLITKTFLQDAFHYKLSFYSRTLAIKSKVSFLSLNSSLKKQIYKTSPVEKKIQSEGSFFFLFYFKIFSFNVVHIIFTPQDLFKVLVV